MTRSYGDSTAVVIDRGAPLVRDALAWRDPLLAATDVAPVASQLAYGTPSGLEPTALPALAGEPLLCDPTPQTRAEWEASHAREMAAERAAQQRQDEQERRKRDEQRKRDEEARAKERANRPKPKSKLEEQEQAMYDVLVGDGTSDSHNVLDLSSAIGGAGRRLARRPVASSQRVRPHRPRVAARSRCRHGRAATRSSCMSAAATAPTSASRADGCASRSMAHASAASPAVARWASAAAGTCGRFAPGRSCGRTVARLAATTATIRTSLARSRSAARSSA